MKKNQASNRPLIYRFQRNFHMQETFHKKLWDEKEPADEENGEDAETTQIGELFSADLNKDEVVQKLRKMLGDKLTDEVEKALLMPWFENIDRQVEGETQNSRLQLKITD